jgi:hypothetical protein
VSDLDTYLLRWRSVHLPGVYSGLGDMRRELLTFSFRAHVDPREVIRYIHQGPHAVPEHIADAIEAARAIHGGVIFRVPPYARIV